MALFEREQPRRILEIGTARGGNLFLLSRAASRDALLLSLDMPSGYYGGGYSRLKTLIFRGFLRSSQRLACLRGNSHDRSCLERVRTLFQGSSLDLLFINRDHTYEGVRKDHEMYSGLVRDGGLIAFHGIVHDPEEANCHVETLWNEIKGDFHYQEVIESRDQGWAGIDILRKLVTE
jgi:predicted O-methyltransferase YrrM